MGKVAKKIEDLSKERLKQITKSNIRWDLVKLVWQEEDLTIALQNLFMNSDSIKHVRTERHPKGYLVAFTQIDPQICVDKELTIIRDFLNLYITEIEAWKGEMWLWFSKCDVTDEELEVESDESA